MPDAARRVGDRRRVPRPAYAATSTTARSGRSTSSSRQARALDGLLGAPTCKRRRSSIAARRDGRRGSRDRHLGRQRAADRRGRHRAVDGEPEPYAAQGLSTALHDYAGRDRRHDLGGRDRAASRRRVRPRPRARAQREHRHRVDRDPRGVRRRSRDAVHRRGRPQGRAGDLSAARRRRRSPRSPRSRSAPSSGSIVHVGDIAQLVQAPAPPLITRINRQNVVYVGANLAPGARRSRTCSATSTARVAALQLPATVTVAPAAGGNQQQVSDTVIGMSIALLLSIVLVYLLMVALYNSYRTPFIIMFAVPVAVVGALGSLALDAPDAQPLLAHRLGAADRPRHARTASCWSTSPTRAAARA